MKKLLIAMLAVVSITACTKKDDLQINEDSDVQKAELSVYAETPEVIDYKIARYLAYQELEDGAASFINLTGDYELTELPRVIYDYDNLPKYYEFDVTVGNAVVATVTTHAKKEEDAVIAFMFEGGRNSVIKGYDAFVGDYPDAYYGIKGTAGSSPVKLYKSDLKTPVVATKAAVGDDVWAPYYALLDQMDEENRAATLAAIEEMKQSEEFLESESKDIETYWDGIMPLTSILKNYSDKEICRSMAKIDWMLPTKSDGIKPNNGDIYNGNPSSYVYIIPQFNNEKLKSTRWSGKCGPGIVSWTYRGLYSNYPHNTSQYIPIHGDKSTGTFTNYSSRAEYGYYDSRTQADHGVYKNVDKRCGPSGELYELGLKNAIKDLTGGTYKVVTTAYSHKNIKANSPVFVMAVMDGNPHYFLAFGYGYTKKGLKKTNYIYIMDNGAMTKNNTYRQYYPYWHKETSNYGLRYKVAKK